jgi:hypothetical protein
MRHNQMRRGSTVLPTIFLTALFVSFLSPFLCVIGKDLVFAIWGQAVEGLVVDSTYIPAVTACSAGRGRHGAYRDFDYQFIDAAGTRQHVSERFFGDGPCPGIGDAVQIEYLPNFGDAARRHEHDPGVAIMHIVVPCLVIAIALFFFIKREEPTPRVFNGLASEDRPR